MGHSSESSSSSSGCSSATSSCPPDCSIDCCEALCTAIVNCRLNSAVVRVHGQSILTTVAPTAALPAFVWSGVGQNVVMAETHGSGFLIKGNLIVCPASLVLIPQDILYVSQGFGGGATGPLYRYPYVNPAAPAAAGVENVVTQVSRILVDIFINEKGAFYTYEASLRGVEGAGDVALLEIDQETDWNGWNPCLKCCHPYFRWSKSRKTKTGDPIFVIGDLFQSSNPVTVAALGPTVIPLPSDRVIYTGSLSSNQSADNSGLAQYELVVTDITAGQLAKGAVILNNCGAVIGMFTDIVGQDVRNTLQFRQEAEAQFDGKVAAGVSEFYMRWPLKAFLQGLEHKKFGRHLLTVTDVGRGNFLTYAKGYLGIAWTPVSGNDYSYLYGSNGLQYPALNATGTFPAVTCTENIGIRVQTMAQTSPVQIFNPAAGFPITLTNQDPAVLSVPYSSGGVAPSQYPAIGVGWVPDAVNGTTALAASPLQGTVFPNDIIFQISKCKSSGGKLKKKAYLGNGGSNGKRQIAPLLFSSRTMPGDSVFVDYRSSINYWTTFGTSQVSMQTFPPLLDYPWGSRDSFPILEANPTIIPQGNLTLGPYAGFVPAF
jgi:hypothetical protein